MRLLLLLALAAALSAGTVRADVSRTVYLVRHGEAGKNTQQSGNTNPGAQNYDSLTDLGRTQVLATARRLQQSAGLKFAITAPEQRTRDTALAITLYSMIPFATVDNDLTSKAYEGESPLARADRTQRAIERELDRLGSQPGNLAVITHGCVRAPAPPPPD